MGIDCENGNMNGLVGDGVKEEMNYAFGVLCDKKNGRRLIDFCAERVLRR